MNSLKSVPDSFQQRDDNLRHSQEKLEDSADYDIAGSMFENNKNKSRASVRSKNSHAAQ